MGITALDHLYVETHDWDASVAFWEGLGMEWVDRWGTEGHRAGRLEAGTAAVVLAEVAADATPACNVFFSLDDADAYAMADGVRVITALEPTHWGTRWIRVEDPEGRTYCLEADSEE